MDTLPARLVDGLNGVVGLATKRWTKFNATGRYRELFPNVVLWDFEKEAELKKP